MAGTTNLARLLAALLVILGLAACSLGKPLEPGKQADTDDIPSGPGLFSGADGEFAIYRD